MNKFWRLAHKLYIRHGRCTWFVNLLMLLSNIIGANSISVEAVIGEGTVFHHRGVGCVVHERAVIGQACHVFQNVTIGQTLSRIDRGGTNHR